MHAELAWPSSKPAQSRRYGNATTQVLREARDKERELQNARAPTDVSGFLAPVGVWELKHLRKLSSLTSLTYYMHLVTVSARVGELGRVRACSLAAAWRVSVARER